MQVYKFGGASIATPERMKALLPILTDAATPMITVVSALGKTTNALEEIVAAACRDNKEQAHQLARDLENEHLEYTREVLNDELFEQAKQELNVLFTELQWAVDDATMAKYDYSYDQIVCVGELLSSRIFAFYLKQEGLDFEWVDIRDVIRTDSTYRDARVDWEYTEHRAQKVLGKILGQNRNVITQGFIGATADNASVTLGREGSDYTAAMLAGMLKASDVTIWKDVEGLQNADPKLFENTVKVEAITYHEVIEMAFYGAQVIHPKTIKPLQNNGIPLYVKCFLHKNMKGTLIQQEVNSLFYPPLIILKKEQVLLQLTTKDFSFITEDYLSNIYNIFHRLKVKINLIQNAAISFVVCVDQKEDKVRMLVDALSKDYNVFQNENVSLLTIRHYTPDVLAEHTRGRYILLEQKTRHTVQLVIK